MSEPPDSPSSVVVGWREWLAFPEIDLPAVRAKIDSGARTSSIHAHGITVEADGGAPVARFLVHPLFRQADRIEVACRAPVIDRRDVTSSSGHTEHRVVVEAMLRLGLRSDAPEWPVEVTLTDRRGMRFPMLLGREAMAGRVVVDPAASFLLGRPDHPRAFYE